MLGSNGLGLFEPGSMPRPTMGNWTKNMESWERPFDEVERRNEGN